MARQSIIPGAGSVFQNRVYDDEGNVIMEMTSGQYMVREPDGSFITRNENSTISLMDGLEWCPLMATGPQPIRIGVCTLCRNPPYQFPVRHGPKHGLVSMRRAKRCASCGRLLCPIHRRKCSDHKWRCPACSRKHRAKTILFRVFFSLEQED